MNQLTDQEKRYLALALQSYAMKHSPTHHTLTVEIAEKLGVLYYLKEYLLDWVSHTSAGTEPGSTVTPEPEEAEPC